MFEKINIQHEISLAPSPNDGDLAIVSINSSGDRGELNGFVMSQYGYTTDDLPRGEQLKSSGFGSIGNTKGKAILFVVTIDGSNDTSLTLEKNFRRTLVEFMGWLQGKKVWLPMLGTGVGGLTLEDSYSKIVKVLNEVTTEYNIQMSVILSLPANERGKNFYDLLKNTPSAKEKEVESFLKRITCSFYLVGSIWEGADQSDRFFKEGIWETGYEDGSYIEVIDKIKMGDILIIKSTFATKERENYLRVKAMGIVVGVSMGGTQVKVDWKVTGLKADVLGLGYLRTTIIKAVSQELIQIFSAIESIEWSTFFPTLKKELKNINKIASLLSDTEIGLDYLSIDKDVMAFARVIAAKAFEPPLAIALFGKWGSGKSFFMRKLKDQVISLSEKNPSGMYCNGVVHIHFNAWSYMDANLWASFVSRIFEGLQEYIKNNTNSSNKVNTIKEELSKQLNVTKASLKQIQEKKQAVQSQIKSLEKSRTKIKNDLELKISNLKKQTAWDVLMEIDKQFHAEKRIEEALKSNDTFGQTKEELEKIIPKKYWDNPEEAVSQIKSKYTFLKEFFRRDKIKKNVWATAIIILIILLVPLIISMVTANISKINFLIPQVGISFLIMVGAAWRRAEIVYKKLQPIAASFWKLKEESRRLREEALAKFVQDEKVLKIEIENGKAEILLINEQIHDTQIIFEELDYKLNNAFATETLYSFIDERSRSEDYQKHLGIISLIRKDFEILNGLFIDHKSEVVNQIEAVRFRQYFKKPVERIILYIDDLDRCPEENVVQVLEAVNLLMAFPLFVVIVGVDSRWVKNALLKKHAFQFTGKINGAGEIQNGVEMIEPADYLEKIFQVPFHLKEASPTNVRQMIKQLATSKPEQLNTSNTNDPKNSVVASESIHSFKQENEIIQPASSVNWKPDTLVETLELLELTDQEVDLMQDMGEIIGSNPRALKRFVNVYRIIKAHDDYKIELSDSHANQIGILFLLALSVGHFKKLMPSFQEFICDKKNVDNLIFIYFELHNNVSNLTDLKARLEIILSDENKFDTVRNSKAGIFGKHDVFVKRFTFKNI